MNETELYKELGILTKDKERWEESIPYVASLLSHESVKIQAKALWMIGEMGLAYPQSVKADAPVIAYFGPFVAFLAISTSFFGHYMGAREGLNGIIVKLTPGAKMVSKRRNRIITLFFLLTLWFVATVNPSILSLIESLGGPIIAIILFLMPMYAIAKIPAMKKYQGKFSNVFITVMGIVTIASLLLSFI